MTVDRPYSRAISFEAARREIQRCAGTQFDPAIVEAFLAIPLGTLVSIRQGDEDSRVAPDETGGATGEGVSPNCVLGFAGREIGSRRARNGHAQACSLSPSFCIHMCTAPSQAALAMLPDAR